MYPVLFSLPGGLAIHSYGVALTLAIATGVFLAHRWGRRANMPKDFGLALILIGFGATLIGSRGEYVRTNWHLFEDDLWAIFDLRSGGQVFYGGLVVMFTLVVLYAKRHRISALDLLDILIPAAAVAQVIGRLGCFFAGCCHGGAADLPWAVTFADEQSIAPTGVPLHPTQLYAAMYCAALATFLIWLRPRKQFNGQVMLSYFSIYPVLRFGNELLRDDPERGYFLPEWFGEALTSAQGISIVMLCVAAVGWAILSPRKGG